MVCTALQASQRRRGTDNEPQLLPWKRIRVTLGVLLSVLALLLFAAGEETFPVLSWSDEFDSPAGTPIGPPWTAVVNGEGGGNQELEYYVPEAAALDGSGHLVLTAQRDTGSHTAWYGPSQFTSAKVWTRDMYAFRYGRLEVRAALPAGHPGMWPAIWLLGQNYDHVGWPDCGEIDVMENFGRDHTPDVVGSAIHTPTDNTKAVYTFPGGTDATEFHTYALDWRPSSLTFSVDGNIYETIYKANLRAWPFDQPFFIILNLAVGGTLGGDIPATASFPQQMMVDYVRVYNAGR